MAKTPDIQAQRRANLKSLVTQRGDLASLAKAMGLAASSYLSQMAGGHRTISDDTARAIERAAGKPVRWLDEDHTARKPARQVANDTSFVQGAVQAVVAAQQELNASITPEKYAEIVQLVYELAQLEEAISPDYAKRLVKLTM
ncbi:hypothetical protein CAL26_09890 [Bordetella genomosp. 9]|uniref:Uncharacterized protein n=1 Tax=Bordetella genomosp. 9 TaxID=1416803 RepID=A0A261RGD0_9BORD|nr:hypothetical protein [Bordetella genomosp. 9]OZI23732.1 hypothetical protein CAL26_09890 [Bordetella genomosp. 9]